jgi:hypothetical protein
MTALAPDLTTPKIHRSDATRCNEHAGERTRHAVDEDRARGKFGALESRTDDRVIADLILHRHLDTAGVVETVRAQAELALTEIERDALRFTAVVAAGVKAQISPADQAIQAFRGCGNGGSCGDNAEYACKCEMTNV